MNVQTINISDPELAERNVRSVISVSGGLSVQLYDGRSFHVAGANLASWANRARSTESAPQEVRSSRVLPDPVDEYILLPSVNFEDTLQDMRESVQTTNLAERMASGQPTPRTIRIPTYNYPTNRDYTLTDDGQWVLFQDTVARAAEIMHSGPHQKTLIRS